MLGFALSLAVVVAMAPEAAPGTPNVILIVADDMGYGDLACYGAREIRTPNFDRMAREGSRFTDFCVAQPVCTASRAALLSGCYPNRIGMAGALNHTSKVGIHADETLLPELLRAKGYATTHLGKWHLGTLPEFFPTRNGFDSWFGIPYSNDNGPLHPTIRGIPGLPLYENDQVIETDPDQSRFTRRFTEKAIQFLRENRSRPFFLYVPHVMPHVPIFATERFLGRSGRGLYGDVVEELDWSLGEILNEVKTLGIDEQTLILFLSDNGPFLSYGTHAGSAGPFREGKLTTFEGGVRVPFLARWPGHVPAARVSDSPVTSIDLLPTLARLCQTDLPSKPIDGVDRLPVLLGQQGAEGRPPSAYYSGGELQAVRSGRWKLHFPHDYLTVDGPPGSGGKPANFANMKPKAIEESGIQGIASRHGYTVARIGLSLFDLSNDPGESHDVSAEHPEQVAALSAMADRFRDDLGDSGKGMIGRGVRPSGLVRGE